MHAARCLALVGLFACGSGDDASATGAAGASSAGGAASAGHGGAGASAQGGSAGKGGGALGGQGGSAKAAQGGQGGSAKAGQGGASGSGGSAGVKGGAAGQAGGAGAPIEVAPYDVVGIVGTGQSLSVGATSLPVLSTTQPYANVKLDVPLTGGPGVGLIPLVEPIRVTGAGPYPGNIDGETPHTSMANQLSATFLARTGKPYVTAHSVVGEGGQLLTVIQKGGPTSYKGAMNEAASIHALVVAAKKTFGYGAVVLTHGESDGTNAAYGDGLVKLQSDYEADLSAITQQTTKIPLVLTQQSTFPPSSTVGAISADLAWQAAVTHGAQIVCVGPKYAYAYSSDFVHLTARAEVRLGVKYAQVVDQVVNRKKPWTPLQPHAVVRAADGLSVHVELDVPVPPIGWDETLAPPHQNAHVAWASGRGFEVTDTMGVVPITQVVIVAPDAVRVDLGRSLVGAATLAHAMTQDADSYAGGLVTGRRGQLRDADPFVGVDAATIACVVQSGGATIAPAPGSEAAFATWGARDLVALPGGGSATIVASGPAAKVLSTPWNGPGGTRMVEFRSDQRNHLVHFTKPIP